MKASEREEVRLGEKLKDQKGKVRQTGVIQREWWKGGRGKNRELTGWKEQKEEKHDIIGFIMHMV